MLSPLSFALFTVALSAAIPATSLPIPGAAQAQRAPFNVMTAPEQMAMVTPVVHLYELPCASAVSLSAYDMTHMHVQCSSGEQYALLFNGTMPYVAPWVSVEELFALQPDPARLARATAINAGTLTPSSTSGVPTSSALASPPSPASTPDQAGSITWTVDVKRDEFAGTQTCRTFTTDQRIEIFTDSQRNQMVGFRLSSAASQPVYRVDSRRPENFNYLVMSPVIQSYMRTQWDQGLVLIPYNQVARGRAVTIRGSAEAVPETFDISTIQAGMRAAEARGCLRVWVWNVG